MNLNWREIRTFNGSQSEAFEELCTQLARQRIPEGTNPTRKGTPDAGVEFFVVFENGEEWGWQAKYFNTLGDTQWNQMDRSVRTALDKHPGLTRYFICVPLDRPDARIGRQLSALQRWHNYVERWQARACELGREVEFVWWGSSELLDMLSSPENTRKVSFWFGGNAFDQSWFATSLGEALDTAGPRYTPPIHVDMPISGKLETFSRSEKAFDEIRTMVRDTRRVIPTGTSDSLPEGTDNLENDLCDLSTSVRSTLSEFSVLYRPYGDIPVDGVKEKVSSAVSEASRLVGEYDRQMRQYNADRVRSGERVDPYSNPFRERFYQIVRLERALDNCYEVLTEFERLSNSRVMVLTGEGGIGKTHLLCNFAKSQIDGGAPAVLLMGQQYLSLDPPWSQTLNHLGLNQLSRDEFIGSLEAAAEAANSRVLLIIDAVNEGQGRELWPAHMASFLAPLTNSPWIGVILSVRSPYQDHVLPQDLLEQAVVINHEGFSGVEFDAVRSFFDYYQIEFPSSPLLQPEFRNPLFLKTLCEGLQNLGERTLPRGTIGVTSIFDTYLRAVNSKLALRLNYDPGENLVRAALERIARRLAKEGIDKRWLDRIEARNLVNELLPRSEFSRSLYAGIVSEGLLLETRLGRNESTKEVVQISYERFADHVIVDTLLRDGFDANEPVGSFRQPGVLAFLLDPATYVPSGILEALSVRIPELTGRELLELAPELRERKGIGHAFLRSIVWRRADAISQPAEVIFREFTLEISAGAPGALRDGLDTLLTVSTIPNHPFNADFLDRLLRECSMPERDAWWSTYLHRAWGEESAVDRLVQWASQVSKDHSVEPEVVRLCSIALTWMLSTANRFLRDKATKALVSLLTGRFISTVQLVEMFTDVDDPYVLERVYAAAYGVSMRTNNANDVERLAGVVYSSVFESDEPQPHILLRDYARGAVERAIYLGSDLSIDENLIRPPYNSCWPDIPENDDSYSPADEDGLGKHAIYSSLDEFLGDFYIYVIGRGSTSNWLSLSLDEDAWQSPNMRMQAFLSELPETYRNAWEEYEGAQNSRTEMMWQNTTTEFVDGGFEIRGADEESQRILDEAGEEVQMAFERFHSMLTPSQVEEFDTIDSMLNGGSNGQAPRIASQLLRRYILRRVFDLGWTEERFGDFDAIVNSDYSRDASKPERIGKKYQWIAYHEILAFIADHYQCRGQYSEDDEECYDGPWQETVRDIDPSCTLASTFGGGHRWGQIPSWWAPVIYSEWGENTSYGEWIADLSDIPPIEDLLMVEDHDGIKWVNVDGLYNWQEPLSADVDLRDAVRRELFIFCTGYLMPIEKADEFMEWSKGVDFWGRWMPHGIEIHDEFLGEYIWSNAFKYHFERPGQDIDWIDPGKACPTLVRIASTTYHASERGHDCSIDSSFRINLPHPDLVGKLSLRWNAENSWFVNGEGERAAFDPTVHEEGPSSFLIREDILMEYLNRANLALCWTVVGEKWCVGGGMPRYFPGALKLTGAYRFAENGTEGFLKSTLEGSREM